ncbi:MAG: FHA domain-containing protein [Planctomycetaceae bacterium]
MSNPDHRQSGLSAHATIRNQDDTFIIVDNNSSNGTMVNGRDLRTSTF